MVEGSWAIRTRSGRRSLRSRAQHRPVVLLDELVELLDELLLEELSLLSPPQSSQGAIRRCAVTRRRGRTAPRLGAGGTYLARQFCPFLSHALRT